MRRFSYLVTVLAFAWVPVLAGLPGAPAADATEAGTPGYAITPIAGAPGAFSVAVDQSTQMVYSLEAYNENMSVIDGATGTVEASVPMGIYPAFLGVAVDPATDTIYVDGTIAGSNTGSSVVEVISGATDAVLATVPIGDGILPGPIAVNPVTGTVYVTEENQAAIAVVDGATNTLTTSVSLGYHTWPNGIAVNSRTDTVYITNDNTDALSVVNGATNVLAETVGLPGVPGPDGPSAVVVDSSTNTVFVGTNVGLVRVDGSSDSMTGDMTAEASDSLGLDATTGTIYASKGFGATAVINAATLTTTGSIPVGGQSMSVDSLTHTEYIATGTVGVALFAISPGISPVITSSSSAILTAGRSGTFTVTATGTPTPVFSETGALPTSVHFSASGVLSGTPAADSGGKYRLTITASNTVIPAAVSVVTLTVRQAPSITSAEHAGFRAGAGTTSPWSHAAIRQPP